MIILYSEKLRALEAAAYRRRLTRPQSLFRAFEAGDDGTSRDECLRQIAAELIKVGFVRPNDRFISTYDVRADREHFIPAVKR